MQSLLQSAARDALEDVEVFLITITQLAIGVGALVGGTTVDHADLNRSESILLHPGCSDHSPNG